MIPNLFELKIFILPSFDNEINEVVILYFKIKCKSSQKKNKYEKE